MPDRIQPVVAAIRRLRCRHLIGPEHHGCSQACEECCARAAVAVVLRSAAEDADKMAAVQRLLFQVAAADAYRTVAERLRNQADHAEAGVL